MTAAPRIVFEALTGAETLAARASARAIQSMYGLLGAVAGFNPGEASAAAASAAIGLYGLVFIGHAVLTY